MLCNNKTNIDKKELMKTPNTTDHNISFDGRGTLTFTNILTNTFYRKFVFINHVDASDAFEDYKKSGFKVKKIVKRNFRANGKTIPFLDKNS